MSRFAGLALAAAVLVATPGARAGPAAPGHAVEAALADQLFAAQRWEEAAVLYHRVARGETGDAPEVRRVAAYRVAIALHYLGLHQASLGAFAAIADDPGHPRFGETLVWLAGLATVLPEPDEVVALLGRYGPGDAAPYDNPTQRLLHAQLMSLLGRHAYRARRFEDAIRAFEKVGPDSPEYVQAEFLTALAHVQRRKPAPALAALGRLRAVLERRRPSAERTRLLDLVHLSMARTHYSHAVVALPAACCGPSIDPAALQGAFESYARVDAAGPSWPPRSSSPRGSASWPGTTPAPLAT